MTRPLYALVALTALAPLAFAQTPVPGPAPPSLPRSTAPAGVKLYIVSPKNGAVVKSPVTVVFGLSGMGIAPAGMPFENTGHHHLLIDADLPANVGMPLPANDNIRHFGKGQTEVTLDLKPGKHSLQLVLGDHLHIPFLPVVSSPKITVTVTQ
jgi:Domain of unknown function (DUF4399)